MKIRNYIINYIKSGFGNENIDKRENWIDKQLHDLSEGKTILDAGAGQQRWKNACKHLQYTSQDFCQYDGIGDEKGLQNKTWNTDHVDIVSDIIDIPVRDNSYDAILCSEVLEHLPYPELAIKEFARILHRGGVLLLTAPFCSFTHMSPYHFCTGFNRYWYERHLVEYGFEIEEITSNGNYFLFFSQELSRLPSVIETYFGKRNKIIYFPIILLNRMLKKYCVIENDSDALLCFGYHVKAKKII